MDGKKTTRRNFHLEMRNLKANRASGTGEQRKERLRIRCKKIEQKGEPKNYMRKTKGR